MDRSSASPVSADSAGASRPWVGNAFGLSLEADFPVLGLKQREAGADARRTLLRLATPKSADAGWLSSEAERLADQRYPDGSVMMTVDAHPEQGYRIDAPGHGLFRVSADGALVECAPAENPSWRWHRPFFAQALPIAASLSGMEVLHASGVIVDECAIAFVGHSGAGKTSLALHLVDQGAPLLADDVVAISPAGAEVHAHPGARFANVAEEQLGAVAADRRERLGRTVGRSEKLHILVEPMADIPAPLSALYFLERGPSVGKLAFERLQPPDPRMLLAATFLSRITAPARMRAQLEVHALTARTVATFRLRIPPGMSAAALAPVVAAHAREVRAPRSGP